jgi:hypothetical protein
MSLRYVWAVCIIALYLQIPFSALAQPYKQLTVNDFANAQPNIGYIAHTSCMINFNYNVVNRTGGAYHLNFDIRVSINAAKTWMNKSKVMMGGMLDEVLRHEQGHYNMAYLEQQELYRTFNLTRFTINYQQQVRQIFDRIDAKYRQLNADYDEDTSHMINRKQQSAWNNWFTRELALYNQNDKTYANTNY